MKVRLKNFKGIKAGPELTWNGLDEIGIDFTGKQGLIAFAGENGGGKSTLLENLHHYPQLVSRGGPLWQHVLGREAEKEFESDFMGHHYRSVIKMDADQGKQEGYLWIDGKPSVNGKITAYKEKVNEIFGQPFTYFRSQFCPQKSKNTQVMQIENMTAGVFRELLQQFLNLQRYAAWEDTAKQAGNILAGQIAGIDQRITALEETTAKRPDVELAYSEADFKAEMLRDDKTVLQHDLEEKRKQVDTLKATIQANALALARRADLQAQIERLTGELAKEKAAAETEINALGKKWKDVRAAIVECDATLQGRENIQQAAEVVKGLEDSAADLQAKLDAETSELPGHQQRAYEVETKIATLKGQLKDLKNDPEVSALDRELAKITAQLGNKWDMSKPLAERDEACKSETCSFIVGALQAEKEIPDLEAKKKELEEKIEAKKAETTAKITGIEAEITTAGQDLRNPQQVVIHATECLTLHRQDLARVRREITLQKALADKLPDIKIAESRKADLEKQIAEVTEAGTQRRDRWSCWEMARINTIARERIKLEEITVDETAELSLLQAQKEITEIETVRIPAIEKEVQAAREKIATLQAELSRIKAAEKEMEGCRLQREALALKVSRWRYLQLGCGKTGLQNLRIDGAAPRIIYNANRLLSQAYGARYAVRLETQNDAGKEDLQIKIIMENGQEVYLDDISGGQRTWNVQALWLAMSLLNQEKSGRKYDYFCSDESDGALDVENAEKYTALYRPFMAEAELTRLIYISHKPSCRAMSDNELTFRHGRSPEWG